MVFIVFGGVFGFNGNGILGIGLNVGLYVVSGFGNVVMIDLLG